MTRRVTVLTVSSVCLLAAACGKTSDTGRTSPARDAGATDAAKRRDVSPPPDGREGFPHGAVATWGFADEAGTAPDRLVVYADGVTHAPPIASFDLGDCGAKPLAFDSQGLLYVACDMPFALRMLGPSAPPRQLSLPPQSTSPVASLAVGPGDALYLLRRAVDVVSSSEVDIVEHAGVGAFSVRIIRGPNTALSDPTAIAADGDGRALVTAQASSRLLRFSPGASGDERPEVSVLTPESPAGVAIGNDGTIHVSSYADNSIAAYDADLHPLPDGLIVGPHTALHQPGNIAIDALGRLLVPSSPSRGLAAMSVFPAGAAGDVAPMEGARWAADYVAVAP